MTRHERDVKALEKRRRLAELSFKQAVRQIVFSVPGGFMLGVFATYVKSPDKSVPHLVTLGLVGAVVLPVGAIFVILWEKAWARTGF